MTGTLPRRIGADEVRPGMRVRVECRSKCRPPMEGVVVRTTPWSIGVEGGGYWSGLDESHDTITLLSEAPTEDRCHCGNPVYTHDDGFTRGLCEHCDAVRCDTAPGACRNRYWEGEADAADAPTEDGHYIDAPASVMAGVWQRTYEQTARERDEQVATAGRWRGRAETAEATLAKVRALIGAHRRLGEIKSVSMEALERILDESEAGK